MTEASIESDGIDVFVVYNGTRIAKRADPNTPQAGTWVSLEPGYRVFDKDYPEKLIVEREDKIVSQLAAPVNCHRASWWGCRAQPRCNVQSDRAASNRCPCGLSPTSRSWTSCGIPTHLELGRRGACENWSSKTTVSCGTVEIAQLSVASG